MKESKLILQSERIQSRNHIFHLLSLSLRVQISPHISEVNLNSSETLFKVSHLVLKASKHFPILSSIILY